MKTVIGKSKPKVRMNGNRSLSRPELIKRCNADRRRSKLDGLGFVLGRGINH
jgi:hypothetical protein